MDGVEEDVERQGLIQSQHLALREVLPVVEQIRRACEKWCFFQVKNHGMPFSLMIRTQQVLREFLNFRTRRGIRFERKRKKMRCLVKAMEIGLEARGGVQIGAIACGCIRFLFLEDAMSFGLRILPLFRETVGDYCEVTDKLVRLISELLSEGLGLETSFVNDYFAGKSQQVLQVNYYPPCPQPDVTTGLRKHSGNNLITLLLEDAFVGLQVKKDEEGITVKPVEGWFVVYIGDQI